MDSTVIVLVVVIAVLVVALIAAGLLLARRRRSERLQERFGPEYDRSVDRAGDKRAAEADLAEREKRHRKLDIRDLRPEERDRFAASWEGIQRQFVDDPRRAVHDADVLVVDIMRTRGYPVGETDGDFDRRADDISVEHPEIVQRYRDARAVRDATARGDVDTEHQRHAVTSYRSLVEALLASSRSGEQHPDQHAGEQRTDQRRADQHAGHPQQPADGRSADGYRADGYRADGYGAGQPAHGQHPDAQYTDAQYTDAQRTDGYPAGQPTGQPTGQPGDGQYAGGHRGDQHVIREEPTR